MTSDSESEMELEEIGGRSSKRGRYESTHEEEMAGVMEDRVEMLMAVTEAIHELVPKTSKDIKKSLSKYVNTLREITGGIKSSIYQALQHNNRQMNEIKEMIKAQNNKIDIIQKEQKRPMTYAGATAATGSSVRVAGIKKPIATEKVCKVQLSLEDERIPGEELKRMIMSKLKPKEAGFKPNRIYSTKDNKVIIESSEDCLDKIKNAKAIRQMNVKVRNLDKFYPRIVVYNAPSDTRAENIANEIIKQNDLQGVGNIQIRPVYKFGPKNKQFNHWTLEVNAHTRNILLQKKTIHLDWHSCKVEDKIYITQCYNCQGYGHIAPKCTNKIACGYCSAEHDTRSCPNKEHSEKHKCILCVKARIEDTKHRPRDGKCLAYKRRMEKYGSNIEFETNVN
ncbi:hypothetical protein HUJ04_006993 [Dendroctonus ponderosae]|uniref:CCHC-type domain-containing protein n=1 Tax=Dendroctonus ponderosae TaxID=77166 RepID=A0AAR5PNV6_DENPD|nr:hypothetical protein HUJ04_006993 [Dendroctonus ponderosae]